jgi:hypothetical protein
MSNVDDKASKNMVGTERSAEARNEAPNMNNKSKSPLDKGKWEFKFLVIRFRQCNFMW